MTLDKKTIAAWLKANDCNCDIKDCRDNHKICYLCDKKMIYGAHESVESQKNSHYRWNKDHGIPKSRGGTNDQNNLIATHVQCNQKKGNNY